MFDRLGSRFPEVTRLVLGELEKKVLLYFWRTESADAKRVHSYFRKSRGGSLNTIQSTLDRLYKKELLTPLGKLVKRDQN